VLPDNDAKNARHLITSRFGEIQGRFAWTRDGRIVISSDKTRHRELWIVDSDGNARKQLTTSDSGGADVQPAVSPDGQYVAFTSSRQQGVQHIFRVDLDGTKLRQLTNGAHEELPGFSTDGQWVYFIDGSDDPPSKSVRKVSINGGETLLVTTAPDRWGIKSFDVNRVDGRLALGLERTSNDSQELKLGIVPAQGGEPKLVDVPPKLFPAWPVWTPDGHSIALRSLGQAGEPLDIWSVPVDGTGPPRQLTDLKTLATRNFTWTSDGKQLLVGRETMLTVPVLIRKVGK
jgi:Tol biopolymer transport system component